MISFFTTTIQHIGNPSYCSRARKGNSIYTGGKKEIKWSLFAGNISIWKIPLSKEMATIQQG